MSGDRRPTYYGNDLSNGPSLAVTKEQHDRIVEARGRPFTDSGIRRRRTGGSPSSSSPSTDESTGYRTKEDDQ